MNRASAKNAKYASSVYTEKKCTSFVKYNKNTAWAHVYTMKTYADTYKRP
jgi:hypothetical protein